MRYCIASVGIISLAALLLAPQLAGQQVHEYGRIERQGGQSRLKVWSPRPLDTAAGTLSVEYGLQISAEDPPAFPKEDLIYPYGPAQPIPRGGSFEAAFAVDAKGRPKDVQAMLRLVVEAYHSRFPMRYRIDRAGEEYSFVPTHVRGAPVNAVLDTLITIPEANRSFQAAHDAIGAALSETAGIQTYCGTGIASNYLLQNSLSLGATREAARQVLRRVGHKLPQGQVWLARSDPSTGQYIVNTRALKGRQGPAPGFPPPPPPRSGPPR